MYHLGRGPFLFRLGTWIAHYRWPVLFFWLLAIAVATPLALALPDHLDRSDALIVGSGSARLMRLLDERFTNPYTEPLVVVLRSERLTVTEPVFQKELQGLVADLQRIPEVAGVLAPIGGGSDAHLRSPDGHTAVILVGSRKGLGSGLASVKPVREAVTARTANFQALDPAMRIATTGAWALARDVIDRTSQESTRAEQRVLLPALLVLLWVFASPLAALLPILLGVAATVLASAAASGLGNLMPLNALAPTTLSMLGLALGIDYCLLIVGRFRESVRGGAAADEAAAQTLATAGSTVITSGVVVFVSLGALLPLGLIDANSVGAGGILVVAAAVALALTLLPALLVILAPWLDWPTVDLKPRIKMPVWLGWGRFVATFKWPLLFTSLALLLALASPLLRFHAGVPDVRWYPPDLEGVQGSQLLATIDRGGLTFPVQVVLARRQPGSILKADGVRKLLSLSHTLHQDRRVGEVIGPVDLRADLRPVHYALLYAHPERALATHPQIGQLFLSVDRQFAYMQVLLSARTTLVEAKGLVRELRALSDGEFEVLVGGLVAINVDYEARLFEALPWVLGTVFTLTGLLLGVAFRSVLVPVKAIALNVLTVSAAIGATVAVFQEGQGHALVGIAGGMGALPLLMPLLIFCLTFGLSMDYELFLLSRVREARAQAPNESAAIASGLAASGGVITAAALIMALVFGAFVTADMIFVKVLGFGLVVAIALEATVIRLVLAPALLNIAGRWNWWPGDHDTGQRD